MGARLGNVSGIGAVRWRLLVEQRCGWRPIPAFKLPVRAFDRQCRRMATPNPYRRELPTLRLGRIMPGREKARLDSSRKGHVELVERQG